jgi:hypothetical protein
MPSAIAINGTKLHEVRMSLTLHTPGSVTYLTYPIFQMRLLQDASDQGVSRIPCQLAPFSATWAIRSKRSRSVMRFT